MCHVESITIGARLSEVHTSGTALQDVCVCMLAYVWPYTTEQTDTSESCHDGPLTIELHADVM